MNDAAQPGTLSTLVAIATVVTPVLLALLAGLGWYFQHKLGASHARQENQASRIRELEDRLRDDRLMTYNSILEPFFLLFTTEASFAQDPKFKGKDKDAIALAKLLSVEYRQQSFKLSLVASDAVVRAYNKLLQFFYHSEADPRTAHEKTCTWLALMGDLLLEVRKSMGNESSSLDRWEMIEWFMKDAPTIKVAYQSSLAKQRAIEPAG